MENLDLENNLLYIESDTDIKLQSATLLATFKKFLIKQTKCNMNIKSLQLLQILRRFHNRIQTIHQTHYGIKISAGRKKAK